MANRKPPTAQGRALSPSEPPVPHPSGKRNEAKHSDKRDAAAYKRGSDAGQKKDPEEGNPYPEGSGVAKSFEHGQLDAQKVRSSDKPPGR
jgi:hypothetical protein